MLCSTTTIVFPAAVELGDAIGEVADEGRVHAAGRLIEEQDGRIGDKQGGQLQQLALPVGEVAGGLVGQPRDADEVQQIHGPPLLGRRARAAQDPAEPALVALGGDEQVLQDGETHEQARELEGAPDAEVEHAVGRSVGDLVAAIAHGALLDALIAGDDIEERRLAGSVGADQAVDLALVDLQVTLRQGRDAAVVLADALDLDEVRHRAAPATPPGTWPSRSPGTAPRPAARARRRSSSSATPGTTPRGRTRMTARKSTP